MYVSLSRFNYEKCCCGEKDKFYFAPFGGESISGSADLRPLVIELGRHFFAFSPEIARESKFFFSFPRSKLKVG